MRIIYNPSWTSVGNKWHLTINDIDLSSNHTGKCRFYVTNDPNGDNETEKNIKIEPDNKSFLFDEKWDSVFLYGKEVTDFHTLDKNQLFALHNSAIQELDRKIIKIENRLSISSTESPTDSPTESLESKIDSLTKQFH